MQEFSLFNAKVPWPDILPGPDSIKQLPLLSQFFTISALQGDAQLNPSTEGTNSLAQILAILLASLVPTSFGQLVTQTLLFGAGSRKAKLRPQLNTHISEVLSARFTSEASAQLRRTVDAQATALKAVLKAAGSTRKGLQDMMHKRIGEFVADGSKATYFDLPQFIPVLSPGGAVTQEVLLPRGAPGMKIRMWEEYVAKIREDWAYAEGMRREMVTRE